MAITAGFTGMAGKAGMAGSASDLGATLGAGMDGRAEAAESLARLSFSVISATRAGRLAIALAASSFCGTPRSRTIAAKIILTSGSRTALQSPFATPELYWPLVQPALAYRSHFR